MPAPFCHPLSVFLSLYYSLIKKLLHTAADLGVSFDM
jgi:hypothetical protein